MADEKHPTHSKKWPRRHRTRHDLHNFSQISRLVFKEIGTFKVSNGTVCSNDEFIIHYHHPENQLIFETVTCLADSSTSSTSKHYHKYVLPVETKI